MSESPAVETFVGVDLGVLNVVVSASKKSEPSAVTVCTNDVSNRSTPAVVGYDGRLRLVGDAADARATQLPKQIISSVPAVLGAKDTVATAHERLCCQWGLTADGKVGPVAFGDREGLELQPASCLASLVQKSVSFAAGESVLQAGAARDFDVALSVPDSWAEAELSTVRGAIDILGWPLQNVHVLPHSAALMTAYAQRFGQKLGADEEKRNVVFVDIGFSQSAISVATYSPPPAPEEGAEAPASSDLVVDAKSCATSSELGTQSICRALAEYVLKKVKKGDEISLASKRGARLMVAAQKALKDLSMLPDTTLALEVFFSDESDLKVDLSRAILEEVAQSQFKELVALVHRALEEAKIAADEVHSVELVGGGMRIPRVQQLLSECFPDAPDAEAKNEKGISARLRFSLDGASAVGTGAAHYSAGHRAVKVAWDLASQKSCLPDEAALEACKELEQYMAQVNSDEVARLASCNALESFIYEVKSWLSGPDRKLLAPDVTEPIVEEMQRWFEDAQYDDSTTTAMYVERHESLKQKLEEKGTEFFEKRRKEKEEKEKFLEEEAEKERQRRQECGMNDDKDDRKMSKSERIKMASKNKEEGNTVFKAGNLEDAAGRYQRALQHIKKFYMLDFGPEEKAEADAISLSVQLNLAQVYLKLAAQTEKDHGKEKAEGVYRKAKASADEALAIDAANVKAKFRKATAMEKLGDLDGASSEVKAALKIDPENADLAKLKERLDKLQAQQAAKAKKMYGKMFG
eukprot:TRINITY_DN72119_c0_g1_i1.p1 TRINITY_DN72119_c0_g1~~TRINITY_DN72119_c0_g1_i1.p1  ORF type:complete len:752 (-),score=184.54 TRINITY_DN72119_c0_g1_i1:335-2590(-)